VSNEDPCSSSHRSNKMDRWKAHGRDEGDT
jgi:hypothetical protein